MNTLSRTTSASATRASLETSGRTTSALSVRSSGTRSTIEPLAEVGICATSGDVATSGLGILTSNIGKTRPVEYLGGHATEHHLAQARPSTRRHCNRVDI